MSANLIWFASTKLFSILKSHLTTDIWKYIRYNLIKEDHPSNTKCCRVCVYYKSSLSFEVGLSPSKNICVTCFIKSLLEIMRNAFYFILKALFIIKIFRFLSWLFGDVIKTVWLKIHDVTTWFSNNCNTHIATEYNKRNIFFKNYVKI